MSSAIAGPSHRRVGRLALSPLSCTALAAGSRCIVDLTRCAGHDGADRLETIEAEAVAAETPREQDGYYWGYSCRKAESLSAVFTESPFESGYDLSIGTSERGKPLRSVVEKLTKQKDMYIKPDSQTWKHMLVVFGGVAGLEMAYKADKELQKTGIEDVKDVFDFWVNLVAGQGSRTIRTEEAVWLGLMGLKPVTEDGPN